MRPDDLKYQQTHEWVKIEGDTATIGITDHAVSHLSDLVFLEYAGAGRLRKVGTLFQWSTQVLAYTFFQPEAGGQRLLVTANSDNTLDIFSGNTNTFQVTEKLECR